MYGTYRQQTIGHNLRSLTPELKLYERPNSPQSLMDNNIGKSIGLR